MFRYNPAANYQPNGGRYLQILSGKDLYKQTIVVSAVTHDGEPHTLPARFPNIFVDYPLGQTRRAERASNLTFSKCLHLVDLNNPRILMTHDKMAVTANIRA